MKTTEVIALADELQAHLERGDLAGMGPVDLGPDGVWDDPVRAARIGLADAAHRLEPGQKFDRRVPGARWEDLAVQLRLLDQAVHAHLAESEARLREVAAQAPALLWSTDADLRLTSLTGAGLANAGLLPARHLRRPLVMIPGAETPESPAQVAHRRALQGEPVAYDFEARGRTYRARVGPLHGPDGTIVGTVGVALNVDETDRDESALPPGEERFRLALQGSPITVYRLDTELRATWFYNSQHGFSPEAVLGKTEADFVLPEEAAMQAAIKRRVLATGVGERAEVRVTVDGEVAYYDMTVEPLRDRSGEIVGVTGAATNITALKQAQDALARREAQLAEAQRLARVGSWELDLTTNRFSWSAEHYRVFGVDPDVGTLTPAIVQAPIHPDDIEHARAIFETSLRSGEPYETEFRVVHPDGTARLIHSRGAMLHDASGRPERMVGTVQDVTDLRRAEEERATQREQQARLDGMLFAARQLADRMTVDLARSSGAIDLLGAQPALTPELRAVIDAAATGLAAVATGLAAATGALAELQRLVPVPVRDESGGPAREPGQPRTEP